MEGDTPSAVAARRGFLPGTMVRSRDGRVGTIHSYIGGTLSNPYVMITLLNEHRKISRGRSGLQIISESEEEEEEEEEEMRLFNDAVEFVNLAEPGFEDGHQSESDGGSGLEHALLEDDAEELEVRLKLWLGTLHDGLYDKSDVIKEIRDLIWWLIRILPEHEKPSRVKVREWIVARIRAFVGVFSRWQEEVESEYKLLQCLYSGSTTQVWLARNRSSGRTLVLKHYAIRYEALTELSALEQLLEENREFFPGCWKHLRTTHGNGRLLGLSYVSGTPFAPTTWQELRHQLPKVLKVCKIFLFFSSIPFPFFSFPFSSFLFLLFPPLFFLSSFFS